MFSEKLKNLRRQAKMSQEQLAEKLHVSRQAVTKWETNAGTPDLVNLTAIADLFNLTIDELLKDEENSQHDYLFESITEYDIDRRKHFDLSFIGAKKTILTGYEGEKIKIRLVSDELAEIAEACKVKLDDVKQRIDIILEHYHGLGTAEAKEKLIIFIYLPNQYVMNTELSINTEIFEMHNFNGDSFEYSGKVKHVLIDEVNTHFELNTNEDVKITCKAFTGRLDINQLSAASTLILPADFPFTTVKKGIANTIRYQQHGSDIEDRSLKGEAAEGCENIIELNGIKNELTITFESE